MTGPMWMPARPPSLGRVLAWHPQPVPVLPWLVLLLFVLYGAGVFVLYRRGVRWPVGRMLWWFLGLATVLAVTATGIEGYGMELFSIHMLQHMVLNMLAPVFLVLGAPVTLLLRALPAGRGRRGTARRILLGLLHSRPAALVMHPLVTFFLFITSLYGLYFTPAFDYLMRTWWGHNLMLIHFLVIGFIYFWGIMGVDPSPRTPRAGLRGAARPVLPVLELAATAPFHAFFGVVVMMSTTLLVSFYSMPIPRWNLSPLSDQATGGGIAWGITELPTLLVLGVLVVRWQRSDRRAARAAERRPSTYCDKELADYNAYLHSLHNNTRR
ncbi:MULTISPECIES: cytochrome c oxidase assembly protein [Arthrobacter]|uniref:Cytochrome c oxidase assembly protein n=1 Tax=Arthrobacter terricola TaxID=2547396 RepID=A0A4R5KBG3_9MICC|nr:MULTISPECIES: cytochrome c oxidase assembly protein [Arthrobacter]MBT8163236.1 cytochrome c oxidase assembly protein [Arthrobacter sp. GN70]TDF91507.1 cytochrome c oxidase assembly protein [Arthrobacter terricola]